MAFDALAALFADMDAGYDAVAETCGFTCTGCEDSCCLTRFYHHTYVEWGYLREGLALLSETERAHVTQQAGAVLAEMQRADETGELFRMMCPLNQEGLCRVYAHRPMICRLHGLPHRLTPPVPGRPPVTGPGCHVFDECASSASAVLDRTPYYARLAGLEQAYRQSTGAGGRVKLTIAEMVLTAPLI